MELETMILHWEEAGEDTRLSAREKELLASLTGEQKLDLDAGGSADNETAAVTAFVCRFPGGGLYKTAYCKMDFGVVRNIRKVKLILNGTEIGMTNSRQTEAAYIVPGRLFREENTLLAVIVDGSAAPIWVKGKRIDYLPDDYAGERKELPGSVSVEPLEKMLSIERAERKDNEVILHGTAGERMLLQFWKGGIWRLRLLQGQEPMVNGLCLEQLQENLVREAFFTVTDSGEELEIRLEELILLIRKSPFSISLFREGGCIFRHTCSFLPDKGSAVRIALQEGEAIYGLGENASPSMDKRGCREDIWTSHDWIHCDIPVPFYISTSGYGFYLNNSYHSYFDMGSMEKDGAVIWTLGGELDYFLIPGEQPKDIIRGYCNITGRPKLPPRWAFGFFQSKTGKDSMAMIGEKIRRFQENDIPLDVISIDPDWQKECNDMQWKPEGFPDPGSFMELLHKNHLHLMLWSSPFVTRECENYQEGVRKGYFLRKADGAPIETLWWKDSSSGAVDFSNPQACRWWMERMGRRLLEGVDLFKIDGGDGGEIPVHSENASGRSGAEFHNLYPLLYAKTVYEGTQRLRPGKRVMTWERTGSAGSGRYPCTWGGDQPADFTGTRVLIKGGQQAGLAGIFFWAPDVGGFGENSNTSLEFFVRSYQWGALAPMSRGHGNKTEPYAYGREACGIVKKYLKLRYRLLPYLYSMAFQAVKENVPVMRAMFLEYPRDMICRTLEYQYFLGDFLMLAPVHETGGREDLSAVQDIYYPDDFIDFWTEEPKAKGIAEHYHAPLEQLPLFVRKGAVIPMLSDAVNTREYTGRRYQLHLYPAKRETVFTLYYDDGISLDYEKGIYDGMEIRCLRREDEIHLKLHMVSDRMDIESMELQIFIHELGRVREAETILYRKQDMHVIL